MKVVPVEKAGVTVTELAAMAKSGSVILTRNGKPIAAVKDLSGSDWETVSLANDPKFIALIERSRESYRQQGGVLLSDLRAELGVKTKSRTRSIPRRRKKSRG